MKKFLSVVLPKYLWILLAVMSLDVIRDELHRQHMTTMTELTIEMKYLEMAEFRFRVDFPLREDLET